MFRSSVGSSVGSSLGVVESEGFGSGVGWSCSCLPLSPPPVNVELRSLSLPPVYDDTLRPEMSSKAAIASSATTNVAAAYSAIRFHGQDGQSFAPRGLDVVVGESLEDLVLIVVAVVAAVVERVAQFGFGLGELLLGVLEIGLGGRAAGAATAGAADVGLRDPDLVQRRLLRLGHLLPALCEPLRVERRPDGGGDAADGSADQGPGGAEGGEQHRRRHGSQGARERIGPVDSELGTGGVVAHHLSPCQHGPTAGKSGPG